MEISTAGFTFLITVGAAFFSWIILKVSVPVLRIYMMDQPNIRSSHCKPIPRGGGIVFVVVTLLGDLALTSLLSYWSKPSKLFIFCLPLALIGFLDDRFSFSASLRYCVQVATAVGILTLANPDFLAPIPLNFQMTLLQIVVIFFITSIINFTNFMDGLDGLVAGCLVVVMGLAAVQMSNPVLWVLIGSLLGFLSWNWSPAKVFMGDVGSTFLGAGLAGLILLQDSLASAFAFLLVSTPLMADACVCLLRRLCAGQTIFQAHRLHLYQRLHQAGWPHARVSCLYIASTAVLAIANFYGGLTWVFPMACFVIMGGYWLDKTVAISFDKVSK